MLFLKTTRMQLICETATHAVPENNKNVDGKTEILHVCVQKCIAPQACLSFSIDHDNMV